MAFKIMITEGMSALGAGLLQVFEDYEHSINCPDLSPQAWCDELIVRDALTRFKPVILINTLQFTEPDFTQSEESFYLVLARVCKELNITVIHISSADVFSCRQQLESSLGEGLTPEPDTDLGCALLAAENAFMDNDFCLVLRLPWMVDVVGGGVSQFCEQLAYQPSLAVSDSWIGCFLSTEDALRSIVAVMQQILCNSKNWGVIHIRTSDKCSEAEFAGHVQRVLVKQGCSVAEIQITPSEQRFIANCGWLSGRRATDCFGIQFRSWRHGLKGKVERWVAAEVSAGRLIVNTNE